MTEGALSADRANRLVSEIVTMFWERVALLATAMLEDGYPPFTMPESPVSRFQKLRALKDTGNPEFWQNPQAQAEYNQLSQQFGSPAQPAQPFETPTNTPPWAILAATQSAQRLEG